jgi:hypothetical protein
MWEELRYAPPATLLRLAEDAEGFAATVDPLQAYPEQEILERITRYRPDASAGGDVIVGQALLADLAAFVEHATARAPQPEEVRGGALSLADAAVKLGVSRTTLDRYRSRGLICHVVRRASCTELCVYSDVLRHFVQRHHTLVRRASQTGRLTPQAREWLRARAVERLAQGPSTLQALAEGLAPTVGLSTRTVRRALEQDAVLNASATPMVRTLDLRAAIGAARVWQMGVSPQAMNQQGVASVAACTRAVQRGRAHNLRVACQRCHVLILPNFHRQDSSATLLAPPSVRQHLPAGAWMLPTPKLSAKGGLAGRADSAAVVAHHFLLWRAQQVMASGRRPGSPELDGAERDLRWAYRLRRSVVESALPDALARVAQHLGSPWTRIPAELQLCWAAAAVQTVAHALDFRSLASVSIDDVHPLRAGAMAVERMLSRPDLDAWVARTPPMLHAALVAPWMAHLDPGDRWAHLLPHASREHASLVARRFGLDGQPPATMVELSSMVRGSAAAAQAQFYAAMKEIRAAARISAC